MIKNLCYKFVFKCVFVCILKLENAIKSGFHVIRIIQHICQIIADWIFHRRIQSPSHKLSVESVSFHPNKYTTLPDYILMLEDTNAHVYGVIFYYWAWSKSFIFWCLICFVQRIHSWMVMVYLLFAQYDVQITFFLCPMYIQFKIILLGSLKKTP